MRQVFSGAVDSVGVGSQPLWPLPKGVQYPAVDGRVMEEAQDHSSDHGPHSEHSGLQTLNQRLITASMKEYLGTLFTREGRTDLEVAVPWMLSRSVKSLKPSG